MKEIVSQNSLKKQLNILTLSFVEKNLKFIIIIEVQLLVKMPKLILASVNNVNKCLARNLLIYIDSVTKH